MRGSADTITYWPNGSIVKLQDSFKTPGLARRRKKAAPRSETAHIRSGRSPLLLLERRERHGHAAPFGTVSVGQRWRPGFASTRRHWTAMRSDRCEQPDDE
jgi:hypothetical protein